MAEEETLEDLRRSLHLSALHRNAAIPQRFEDWTLDTSPVPAAVKAKLVRPAKAEEQRRWNEQSWLIWGHHGVGKTGLAVGYLRQRIEKFEDGLFVTLSDLLSQIRDTYGARGRSEADVLRVYREMSVLVLDDLGAEHVKERGWLEDILYQVAGYRHDNLMPTVFTSNLSPQELGDRIGERVMWRIVEMCGPDGVMELRGRNLRAT